MPNIVNITIGPYIQGGGGSGVKTVTLAEITDLINNSQLVPDQWYSISDFSYSLPLLEVVVTTGSGELASYSLQDTGTTYSTDPEILLVRASDASGLHSAAYAGDNNDIVSVSYDASGLFGRRTNTVYNISLPYDWVNTQFLYKGNNVFTFGSNSSAWSGSYFRCNNSYMSNGQYGNSGYLIILNPNGTKNFKLTTIFSSANKLVIVNSIGDSNIVTGSEIQTPGVNYNNVTVNGLGISGLQDTVLSTLQNCLSNGLVDIDSMAGSTYDDKFTAASNQIFKNGTPL